MIIETIKSVIQDCQDTKYNKSKLEINICSRKTEIQSRSWNWKINFENQERQSYVTITKGCKLIKLKWGNWREKIKLGRRWFGAETQSKKFCLVKILFDPKIIDPSNFR